MKQRITITLDKEILDWIDHKVSEYVFANRSHSFEFLIKQKKKKEENQAENERADHNHG